MKNNSPRRLQMARTLQLILVLFIASLIFHSDVSAQGYVPAALRPGASAGSANLSNFESINPYNGNLNFSLPLVESKGRGAGTFPVNLNINQKFIQKEWIDQMDGRPYYYVQEDNWGERVWGDKGYVPAKLIGTLMGAMPGNNCPGNSASWFYMTSMSLSFTAPDGTQYDFRDRNTNGQAYVVNCNQTGYARGPIFDSVNGTGAIFVADTILRDEPFAEWGEDGYRIYPSGVITTKNGTVYRIDNGLISWSRDSNGNKTTFTYLQNGGFTVTDSLNREITVELNVQDVAPYGLCDRITYKGFGGATRSIRVSYKPLHDLLRSGEVLQTGVQLFPNGFSTMPTYFPHWDGLSNYDPSRASAVWLPDGRSYEFQYNSYGELARVEIPTGGAIEYDWGANTGTGRFDSQQNVTTIYRRILERRLYPDGANLKQKLTLGGLEPLGNRTGYVIEDWSDSSSNLISRTKHFYYGIIGPSDPFIFFPYPFYITTQFFHEYWRNGIEYQTEIYANPGTTLLRRTTYEWAQLHPSWWTYTFEYAPTNNPRMYQTTTLLADSNQVSKTTFSHDHFGNVTDTYEYDFGNGTPGQFLRRSHTDYVTVNPVNSINYTSDTLHILNLPAQTWVSSDIAGDNIVSRTSYEYDNYTSDSTHAPLVDRPNISGHDSNFGVSYTARGNATRVTSYADAENQTGAVSAHRQYDIAGNATKGIDAKGFVNTADYSDRFGTGDADARANTPPVALGQLSSFAFVTSRTNTGGYTTYSQYDFHTGSSVDEEDFNGNVTTTLYDVNDLLDRPKQIITANNRPALRRQTTMSYYDPLRLTTVTSDSKVFGDNLIKTESLQDMMGRDIESRQYETASNYIVSQKQYDALGRPSKTSNPFRPYLSEQPQWTTTSYDALGRVTQITSPDDAVATRQYAGTTVTIADPTMRKRSSTTDALGRLLRVVEDPGGLNYETTYTYDQLGRLRKATQIDGAIAQNRYFMYDDLGRMIRAKQVEQLANSNLPSLTDPVSGNSQWSSAYAYDNNGNVTSVTDANNRTITAIYDSLNRLSLRNFDDPLTPDVSFTYDDPTVLNSKGQLTAVSSDVSATRYTSFDFLGRVTSSEQETAGVTYTMPNYTYDLSGALIAQTYHSGRIVSFETDNIGRLSKVTGLVPNNSVRTYLKDISYNAAGAVVNARLGNGVWESTQFDPETSQVTEISLGPSVGNKNYLKIGFEYGELNQGTGNVIPGTNNGNLAKQTITVPAVGSSISFTATQYYAYDSLNRIQIATENFVPAGQSNLQFSWRQQFTYDRFGNRRFHSNTTTMPHDNGTFNPQVDSAKNQFTLGEGYDYDNEGNLKSNPEGQSFEYDANNRQTEITNTVTQTVATYSYDGNGKRVRKLIGNQETIFIYDAYGKLVAEYTHNQTVTSDGTKYLTADNLGSPRAITDTSGHVISRHDYMPFGEEALAGTAGRTAGNGYLLGSDGVRQKFTGYEADAESGLDFAQARYYSGKHGRFTGVDPLLASANQKNPQSFNRYSYALNNPYKFTDPLGLKPVCKIEGGGNTACIELVEFSISIEEYVEIRINDWNRQNTCAAEYSSCGGDGDEPSVTRQEWYVYEEKFRVQVCPKCGPWDVNGRIGWERSVLAYYPDDVNQMLYEFAQLEAQTAEEDEEAYATWYTGSNHDITIGLPPSISFGNPPSDRVFKHDKNIEDRIKASVDKATGEGKYTEHQASMLKKHARSIINKTANQARQVGTDRFHFRNPSVLQHSTPYYHQRRKNVTRNEL